MMTEGEGTTAWKGCSREMLPPRKEVSGERNGFSSCRGQGPMIRKRTAGALKIVRGVGSEYGAE